LELANPRLLRSSPILLEGSNPTVAPYAGHGECRLRVTSKSHDLESAMKLAQPIVTDIRERSGSFCYGTDADTLESVVGDLLRKQHLTISTAESCTGGLVSKRLTDTAGSSEYVSLNVVTYSNDAKQKMLGVDEEILSKHGAVSPECARAMAEGGAPFVRGRYRHRRDRRSWSWWRN